MMPPPGDKDDGEYEMVREGRRSLAAPDTKQQVNLKSKVAFQNDRNVVFLQ